MGYWIVMPSTREENTRRRANIIKFSQRDGMEIKRFKKIYAYTLSLVISGKLSLNTILYLFLYNQDNTDVLAYCKRKLCTISQSNVNEHALEIKGQKKKKKGFST